MSEDTRDTPAAEGQDFSRIESYREALGSAGLFLRELIDYTPAVIFCYDITSEPRCLFVTKSFETIWGLPRSVLVDNPKAWKDYIVPEDRAFVINRLEAEHPLGQAHELEYRIRDTSGNLRYIQASFIILENPMGVGLHRIGFAFDITHRREAELRAYELAHTDSLTGLPNRVAFSNTLAEMISGRDQACRSSEISVVFIDIDRFARVNETLGHSVGDEYLRKVAGRIKQFIGNRGLVARLGGDEFAMLLTDCYETASIRNRLLSLQHALNQPISVDGESLFTSASIGVACHPKDGDDPGSLMSSAELAMSSAKSLRRGSLVFFSQELLKQGTRDSLRRDMALRHALANDQFELAYQGQYRTPNQGGAEILHGVEVLLRWRHPEFGLVSPADFIPQLEDSGDIIEVGQWVLETACRQLAAWQAQGLVPAGFTLAVNVAPAQLLSPTFVATVLATVRQASVAPERLELELTENALLVDPNKAEQAFRQLREFGVRVAIDDFGTGYSSMSYLRRFRPDTLKIDRSFTADCERDETSLGIVESIVQLARTLNMTVVAEGVEDRPQALTLSRSGCDILQGFLFSRPVSTTDFEALLGQTHQPAVAVR